MYFRLAQLCLFHVLMFAPSAWADSYAYNDLSTGVIHLTDRPLSNDYQLVLKAPVEHLQAIEPRPSFVKSGSSRGIRKKEFEGLVHAASSRHYLGTLSAVDCWALAMSSACSISARIWTQRS